VNAPHFGNLAAVERLFGVVQVRRWRLTADSDGRPLLSFGSSVARFSLGFEFSLGLTDGTLSLPRRAEIRNIEPAPLLAEPLNRLGTGEDFSAADQALQSPATHALRAPTPQSGDARTSREKGGGLT